MPEPEALAGKLVLVTGVGVKPLQHTFYGLDGQPSHLPILLPGGTKGKANIGAATALECARRGACVLMCARSEASLCAVQGWILDNCGNARVYVYPGDLTFGTTRSGLARYIQTTYPDLDLYWVNSLGLGGGTVRVPGDNPYLPWNEVSEELLQGELSVTVITHALNQILWPLLPQPGGRVVYVTSMSGTRHYHLGAAHGPGKAALHALAQVMQLVGSEQGIHVTEVEPGAVDTGLYDPPAVQEAVMAIYRRYGYTDDVIRLGSPLGVAQAIADALANPMHVTEIKLVAPGQPPHRAS